MLLRREALQLRAEPFSSPKQRKRTYVLFPLLSCRGDSRNILYFLFCRKGTEGVELILAIQYRRYFCLQKGRPRVLALPVVYHHLNKIDHTRLQSSELSRVLTAQYDWDGIHILLFSQKKSIHILLESAETK